MKYSITAQDTVNLCTMTFEAYKTYAFSAEKNALRCMQWIINEGFIIDSIQPEKDTVRVRTNSLRFRSGIRVRRS